MATIEPLNSVMTCQAQAVERPQSATPVNTEVPEDGQTVNVDETTAAVTRAQAEDDKGGGSEGAGSQQQAGANQMQQLKIGRASCRERV